VDDGFELDGRALFGSRAKLPLAEGVHGVGVELVVNAADELDTVDGAVTADYGVEDDFPFDMLIDQRGRILRVDLAQRAGSGDFGGRCARTSRVRNFGAGGQFGEIENPASGGAVQVGHVDEHLVDFFRGENLLGLRASGKRREIGRASSLGGVIGLRVRIGPGDQGARRGCADF